MPGSSDRVARISSRINFGRLATSTRRDLPISFTPRTPKYWQIKGKEKAQRRRMLLANLALPWSITSGETEKRKSTKNYPSPQGGQHYVTVETFLFLQPLDHHQTDN